MAAPKPIPDFTARECEVLLALTGGGGNKSLASDLGLRPATVKGYLWALYRRINVQNRTEAALWARDHAAQLKTMKEEKEKCQSQS